MASAVTPSSARGGGRQDDPWQALFLEQMLAFFPRYVSVLLVEQICPEKTLDSLLEALQENVKVRGLQNGA